MESEVLPRQFALHELRIPIEVLCHPSFNIAPKVIDRVITQLLLTRRNKLQFASYAISKVSVNEHETEAGGAVVLVDRGCQCVNARVPVHGLW